MSVSDKRSPLVSSAVRVATYTRISTDEEHQPFSLDAEAQRLGSYIQSQDSWQLVHRFTDQMSRLAHITRTGTFLSPVAELGSNPGLLCSISWGRVEQPTRRGDRCKRALGQISDPSSFPVMLIPRCLGEPPQERSHSRL